MDIMALKKGDKAPDFNLEDQDGKKVSLGSFKGKYLVLYFYPKDDTPGCTMEGIDFTKNIEKFNKLGAEVLGLSADSLESHCSFIDKHKLKVTLLSDPDKELIKKYNAWKKKSMYGREYYGIERSTFIIDQHGKIANAWYGVKVQGHVEEVLKTLRGLKSSS